MIAVDANRGWPIAEAQRFANDNRVDVFPFLRKYFQQIAMGEVAKSAELAREMGYLRASDRIVLNKFELLHIAKEEAKALNATAYRPPLHQHQIPVAGRTSIATFKASMLNMLEGGFISEHDYNIGCRVAETVVEPTPIGPLETLHVKPRRRAEGGNLTAQMWYAPALQMLPVRIRIDQDAETWVDLRLDRAPEQGG